MTVGILLSVRNKATRLPGKVLLPFGDCNVTEFLIRRLKQSKRADRVVVATSDDPRDQVLVEIAERESVAAFKGSADDKLLRYRDACRAFELDLVVIVDGDDPFISVEHIDQLIEYQTRQPCDYVIFANLPVGATGFCLAASALEKICTDRSEQNTEVWGRLFLDDERFTCKDLAETNPILARPDVRMTLDYEADYRFFTGVVEGCKAESKLPTFDNIMSYLAAHPEVIAINQDAQRAYEIHLRASEAAMLANGGQK